MKIIDIYKTNRLSDFALHAAEIANGIDVAEIVEDAHSRAQDYGRDQGNPFCAEHGCALDGMCINQENGRLLAARMKRGDNKNEGQTK
jgi:hypothetical protein